MKLYMLLWILHQVYCSLYHYSFIKRKKKKWTTHMQKLVEKNQFISELVQDKESVQNYQNL